MEAHVTFAKTQRRSVKAASPKAAPRKEAPTRSSSQIAPFGDLPWLRYLPKEESKEVVRSAKALAKAGDYSALAQLLIEWKATAEVYADPELFAQLTAAEDGVDL